MSGSTNEGSDCPTASVSNFPFRPRQKRGWATFWNLQSIRNIRLATNCTRGTYGASGNIWKRETASDFRFSTRIRPTQAQSAQDTTRTGAKFSSIRANRKNTSAKLNQTPQRPNVLIISWTFVYGCLFHVSLSKDCLPAHTEFSHASFSFPKCTSRCMIWEAFSSSFE